MENNQVQEQKRPCFLKRAWTRTWSWVKNTIKSIYRFIFPDRAKERINGINDSYSVILKNGDLYLVYEKQIVIKKLPMCHQNLDIVTIIQDTGTAQLEYEGLKMRP